MHNLEKNKSKAVATFANCSYLKAAGYLFPCFVVAKFFNSMLFAEDFIETKHKINSYGTGLFLFYYRGNPETR